MKVSVVALVVASLVALVWLWASTPPWPESYCKEVPEACEGVSH